jgi:anti-anti-sigma regulatory factor
MGIPPFGAGPHRLAVRVVDVRGERADIAFAGDITADLAFRIERIFLEQIEHGVREWLLDLSGVHHLDTTCAFALMRPVLSVAPDTATVRIRGASAEIRDILRQIGADRFLLFEKPEVPDLPEKQGSSQKPENYDEFGGSDE